MPDRPVLRSIVWGAVGAGIFWGCSLDWNVRLEDAADAAPGSEASIGESSTEDAPDATANDSPPDGGHPDADYCDALANTVFEKEREAARCALGQTGQCGEQEKGMCCKVWVAKKDAAATETLRQSVESFNASSCTFDCSKYACSFTTASSCVQVNTPVPYCSR